MFITEKQLDPILNLHQIIYSTSGTLEHPQLRL